MNINTNTEVTLYDFLNYEVVGILLLFICGFTPCDTIYEWLFFVFAFIAGLVFSKLAENAIWTKWTRNPKWAIDKGDKALEETKEKEWRHLYYINYYKLSKESCYKTIQILEAHYRFVVNLLMLAVVCFSIGAFEPCGLRQFLCMDVYSKRGEMMVIIYGVLLVFACLKEVVDSCSKTNNDIQCEFDTKCASVLLLTITIFLGIIFFILPDSLCCASLFAMSLLGFLAFIIQLKISALVIEGAEYLKRIENENNE